MKPDTYSVTVVWSDEDQAFVTKAIRDAGNLEAQMLRTRRTPQAGTD
jgi:hypothetical protein